MWLFLIAAFALLAITAFMMAIIFLPYMGVWLRARASGAPVGLIQFPMMRLRLRGSIGPTQIVDNYIAIRKAGLDVEVTDLEAHVLAGGDMIDVVDASISADRADLGKSFYEIAAIDLAGRDVVEAVDASVTPRTLECPPQGSERLQGVARDGIRLEARVRVTVRTNLERVVGGATAQTVIARVGEGIVAAIGNVDNHMEILERPEMISKYILEKGLDSGTAYEILSVDVYHVEIRDNIGAKLQEIQANADEQVAQARAEMRRAAAVAREREMYSKVVEMTSQVTEAEAAVPKAMANAYAAGRIWRSPRPVGGGFGRRLWDCHESI
jgi:uncharacterized protein YqfA (UPF0365 family)